MVGAVRFELTTSCTPSKRATKLRYAPTGGTLRCGGEIYGEASWIQQHSLPPGIAPDRGCGVAQPQRADRKRRAPKLKASCRSHALRLVFDTAAIRCSARICPVLRDRSKDSHLRGA